MNGSANGEGEIRTETAKRLVVAVTGASGSLLGLRLLQLMQGVSGWETHVVLSPAAMLTAQQELGVGREAFQQLATRVYAHKDIGSAIASGSFRTEGMVVVPCSMNTLSAIAHGSSDNLITRAADVALKERRRLVLVPREAPLNLKSAREHADRKVIRHALARSEGNISSTARMLGISRPTLYDLLKQYAISA